MLSEVVPSPAWESIYSDRDELAALRYMRARSSNSTPLFVGVKDHSRTFCSTTSRVYSLANRSISVRTFQHSKRGWQPKDRECRKGLSRTSNVTRRHGSF